jgi:hypothetical protein
VYFSIDDGEENDIDTDCTPFFFFFQKTPQWRKSVCFSVATTFSKIKLDKPR